MADDEGDNVCSICYEPRESLRTLPCWHVACLGCILNMAQIGEGRAMKCHQCREPFLFENVRSLPQPVRCRSCRQFLRNPKQLECCSALLCSDCYGLSNDERGMTLCPNECPNSRHQVPEISSPRICCRCFALHTNTMIGCSHSVCTNCNLALSAAHRPCPLCDAIGSPMPIPINPSGQNGVIAGLNNELYDAGQPISQMHLVAAIQTVRMWQRRQQQPVQPGTYTKEHFKQDFPKGCAALFAMAIVAVGWGYTYWLWVVMTLYFVILCPNIAFIIAIVTIIGAAMMLYCLYYHFFATLCYGVLNSLWGFGYQCLMAKKQDNTIILVASLSTILLKPILVWLLFRPIFMDHAIFELAVFVSTFAVGFINGMSSRRN